MWLKINLLVFDIKDWMIKWIGMGMMASGVIGIAVNLCYDYMVTRAVGNMIWGRNQWIFLGACLLQILWGYVVHDFTDDMREER